MIKAKSIVPAEPLPASAITPRAPGIYFDLDEDAYHRDPSLGSGNVRDLWYSPTDYWWGSVYNPDREDDESDDKPSLIRGKAMHKLVLEGAAAYDAVYMRGPDHSRDMTPSEKGQLTKAANLKAAARGMISLPAKDYDRTLIMGAMIAKNPKLASVFQSGLAEVSIFWCEEVKNGRTGELTDVPCKARIDWLKPRGLGDLKSISTWKRIEFKRACREQLTNYRYDMQAAHYMRGRAALAKLVADGAVFGDHDADLLKKIAAERRFAFQFIFFQATKSPVTFAPILSPANPIIEQANRDLSAALDSYVDYMAEFGPNTPWLLLEEPQELAIEELPNWYARK